MTYAEESGMGCDIIGGDVELCRLWGEGWWEFELGGLWWLGLEDVVVLSCILWFFFFFQAEDGIRDRNVTGVQTCALPILAARASEGQRVSGSTYALPAAAELRRAVAERGFTGLEERGARCRACAPCIADGRDRKSVV